MAHRKKNSGDPIPAVFIREICTLYGDCYDDRIEDSTFIMDCLLQ